MLAYKIIARNEKTKQRVTQQFLNGYIVRDEVEANRLAQDLAEKQMRRSRDTWVAVVETYNTN